MSWRSVRADEKLTAFLELEIDGLRVGVNEPWQEMHSRMEFR
jgi:hypothetical protein